MNTTTFSNPRTDQQHSFDNQNQFGSINDLQLRIFSSICPSRSNGTQGFALVQDFSIDPVLLNDDNYINYLNYDHATTAFEGGIRRKGHAPLYSVACLLDFDNKQDDPNIIDGIRDRASSLECKYLIYISRSHMLGKFDSQTGEQKESPRPKYHLLLPFSKDVSVDEWKLYQNWGMQYFSCLDADKAVKGGMQIIFGYCNNPNPHFEWNANGHFIDQILNQADLAPPASKRSLADNPNKNPQQFVPKQTARQNTDSNTTQHGSNPKIGDFFNDSDQAMGIVHECLVKAGWNHFGNDGDNEHFYHPHKERNNGAPSASLDSKGLQVWSSSEHCPLKEGNYSFFGAFTHLKHNGNFGAAKDELLRMGFLPEELTEQRKTPKPKKQEPFPLHAFPPLVGRYVEQVAYAMSVQTSMVITTLLGIMAGAIGNAYSICIKPGFVQPSILWMMIISSPGTLKTPVVSQISKLFDNALYIARAEYEASKKSVKTKYELDRRIYQISKKIHKSNDITSIPPTAPTKEKPKGEKRFIAHNTMLEGCLKQQEVDKNGLTICTSELASWTCSFGEYKRDSGGDMNGWCSCYDGERIHTLRADKERESFVEKACVSIAGMIQPDMAKVFAANEKVRGTGLHSRFLICWPDHEFIPTPRGDIPMDAVNEMQVVFDRMIGIQEHSLIDRDHKTAHMSNEARDLFDDKIDEFRKLAHDAQAMAPYYLKRTGKAARIALVLHVLQASIDNREIQYFHDEISVETVKAALEIERWYFNEAERIYPLLYSGFDANECKNKVFDIIDDADNSGITKRDIVRKYKKCSNELPEILKELIADGKITVKETGRKTLYLANQYFGNSETASSNQDKQVEKK